MESRPSQAARREVAVRESTVYERFPRWSPLVSNLPSILVAGIGAFLLARLTVWLFLPYLAFLAWSEARVLRHSCVDCAYYGGGARSGRGGFVHSSSRKEIPSGSRRRRPGGPTWSRTSLGFSFPSASEPPCSFGTSRGSSWGSSSCQLSRARSGTASCVVRSPAATAVSARPGVRLRGCLTARPRVPRP